MKGFGCSIFLLFAISFSSALTTTNPCRFVTNNKHINDPSACNAYFKCVNGNAVPGNCPFDFWFDKYSGECDYQQNVECSVAEVVDPCKDQCKGARECFVDNPSSCASYFYCKDGKATPGECAQGTVFNAEKKSCVYAKDYTCEDEEVGGTTEETVCKNIPNSVLVRNPADCSIYHICYNGIAAQKLTCAEGSYYNLQSGTCDKKDEVECDVAEKVEVCKGKNEEFTSDPDSCAVWHYCKDNKVQNSGKCVEEQWFDGKAKCQWQLLVPEDICKNRCEGKKSGFVLIPNTKCAEYYHCSAGKINGKKQECDKGKVFDFKLEICIDNSKDFNCPI